jgi:hypothetical protein
VDLSQAHLTPRIPEPAIVTPPVTPAAAVITRPTSRIAFIAGCFVAWLGLFCLLLPLVSFPIAAVISAVVVELAVLHRKHS